MLRCKTLKITSSSSLLSTVTGHLPNYLLSTGSWDTTWSFLTLEISKKKQKKQLKNICMLLVETSCFFPHTFSHSPLFCFTFFLPLWLVSFPRLLLLLLPQVFDGKLGCHVLILTHLILSPPDWGESHRKPESKQQMQMFPLPSKIPSLPQTNRQTKLGQFPR